MSLLLIHGEERALVDAEARRWCEGAAPAELRVEIFDAPARLAQLRSSILEMPLFDDERFVLVRDPPQLSGAGRRGSDGAQALAELLEACPPTTSVCLVAHARVAAGNPVLTTVARLGRVSHHASPRGRDLHTWVHGAARERGLRLPPGGVEHVVRVAGPDLGIIGGELDKLAAYASERPLTMRALTALAAGDEQVQMWSVMEGLLGPQPGRGAAALDRLINEGRPGQYLLATLAGQVRELLLAQALLAERGRSVSLAAELGVPPWRAERLARQVRALPRRLPREWLHSLQRLDARIKAGEVGDAEGLRSFALGAAAALREERPSGQRERRT